VLNKKRTYSLPWIEMMGQARWYDVEAWTMGYEPWVLGVPMKSTKIIVGNGYGNGRK